MKKFLTAIALCLVCAVSFTSCNSDKSDATKYLKSTLKCPSSLKVVSVTTDNVEESVMYDTLYHIASIDGKKYEYIDAYETIHSVTSDSIKILKAVFPARTDFNFVFDAENSFGAMIRDEAQIVKEGNQFMSWNEYFQSHYYNQTVSDYRASVVTIPVHYNSALKVGDWETKENIMR